jgi:hypothetical protein
MCVLPALSGDGDGPKVRSGRRPVRLWPPASQPTTQPEGVDLPAVGQSRRIGHWVYRSQKSSQPKDGVPWELIVTPDEEWASQWQIGAEGGSLPELSMVRHRSGDVLKSQLKNSGSAIEVPQVVWKKWLAADLQDVVGIHFHEVVSEDSARILFTIHKVPADDPDSRDGSAEAGASVKGCRIEATLLAPLEFHLDQTVVVRADPLKKELAGKRAEHELGHAEVSQAVFLAVLRGVDDWHPETCSGHCTKLAYYWKRDEYGRKWKEFRGGAKKVRAMRTTIVLVPPTRWSKMLPIPPERVTAKHLQDFNDEIIRVSARFAEVDAAAQSRFHAQHGAFESGD